ncbi:hypothetical protein CPB83DRAFT_855664 [Crepidotus variabilis]|uniref:Uncharacterized protein n=1 Tax=Crepidotus variabilis TaxID=179855 RepID=A0A9P6EF77_9AGAR|nr:hypothetical protein CPB83DRAFT_855664 [Crepidotus variabilis]
MVRITLASLLFISTTNIIVLPLTGTVQTVSGAPLTHDVNNDLNIHTRDSTDVSSNAHASSLVRRWSKKYRVAGCTTWRLMQTDLCRNENNCGCDGVGVFGCRDTEVYRMCRRERNCGCSVS